VLILFMMYLGLIALWRAVEDPSRAARAAAVLTLVGALNLPIIKFSVDWWKTLHQPASLFRMGGPTLDRAFLIPLSVMAVGFTLLFAALHVAAMRNEILRRRVRALQLMQVRATSSDVSAASPASQPVWRILSLGPYASFIVTSYLVTALVVLLLIAWIANDFRNQKRRLLELEVSGVVRRSGRSATGCEQASKSDPSTAR
jgi:heme exporter protein CcmD